MIKNVRQALIEQLATDPQTLPLATGGFIDEAVQTLSSHATQPAE